MHVIRARNVHEALPLGIEHLRLFGVREETRNGPALVSPEPVTTVYERPWERVLFWPERDANPFFHLYESLWMLAGRNDVAGPARYAKQMLEYSDDGKTLHGAYGYRWRHAFDGDQVAIVIARLRQNSEDRRCVIQMWDPDLDHYAWGEDSKDLPCNLSITFRINVGRLDMHVFNRSNDIIWGAYGANAVHFSMLQEHIAVELGIPMGRYYQVSTNFHAYMKVLEPLAAKRFKYMMNPYEGRVHHVPMPREMNQQVFLKLTEEIDGWENKHQVVFVETKDPWVDMVRAVLLASAHYRLNPAPQKYDLSLQALSYLTDQKADWVVAAKEWVQRRQARQEAR